MNGALNSLRIVFYYQDRQETINKIKNFLNQRYPGEKLASDIELLNAYSKHYLKYGEIEKTLLNEISLSLQRGDYIKSMGTLRQNLLRLFAIPRYKDSRIDKWDPKEENDPFIRIGLNYIAKILLIIDLFDRRLKFSWKPNKKFVGRKWAARYYNYLNRVEEALYNHEYEVIEQKVIINRSFGEGVLARKVVVVEEKEAEILEDVNVDKVIDLILYVDKLGIIDHLIKRYNLQDNWHKISQILTGFRSSKKDTLYPYIRSMKKDPENKNNPYNSEEAVSRVDHKIKHVLKLPLID